RDGRDMVRSGRRRTWLDSPPIEGALQLAKLARDLEGALESILGLFLQTPADDAFEIGGQIGVQPRERGRLVAKNRRADVRERRAGEGPCSGSQLEHEDAEREQIRARI